MTVQVTSQHDSSLLHLNNKVLKRKTRETVSTVCIG